jgi:Mu-like prophage I protein
VVNLVTVPNRELMKVGKWQVRKGHEFNVTPELISAALAAHKSEVLRKPVIRLGHGDEPGDGDERFTGDPAVGWVDNVRASEDGATLYGDLVGVPKWLADNMPSAYPSLSVEGMYDYTAPDGTTHDFVLTGLALLGATQPAISSLKSMQDVATLFEADIAAAVGEIGGTAVSWTVSAAADKPYGNVDYADPLSSKKFGITISASAEPTEGAVMASLTEQLAERFGFAPDADEATILAAVDEKLKPAEPAPVVEPQPEQVAAAAAQLGLVMVNKDQYDATVAAAAEGAEARKQQIAEANENVVMAAIRAGKIPPARKDHWLEGLKADRAGTAAVLASLKPILPVQEIGHGITGDVNTDGVDQELEGVHDRIMASLGFSTRKVN